MVFIIIYFVLSFSSSLLFAFDLSAFFIYFVRFRYSPTPHNQDAFLDRSLPVELRWIAIITLKQGVDKYWRKTAVK